jgi:c-di-GMP-binding flagellar brake protein YcgR
MYPKVNQNIIIEIISEERTCKSIVAEVGDKEILIGLPLDLSIVGHFSVGTKLEVTYLAGDNQFRFQTSIIGIKRDNMPFFRLHKPKENEIKKIQRRNNFRVKTNLSLTVKETEVTTIDLSAGGLLFSCKEDYPILFGEIITGILLVPDLQNKGDTEPVTFQGTVRRINRIEKENRKLVAIAFTEINQKDQSKVTRYCFERQRQVRLKSNDLGKIK